MWEVYESVSDVDDALAKASVQLKALDLMVKIRSAGEKVKPGDAVQSADDAVKQARAAVNGKVRS